jgi:antitoxin component YwqK of YwqJK toxin-antitoxin module
MKPLISTIHSAARSKLCPSTNRMSHYLRMITRSALLILLVVIATSSVAWCQKNDTIRKYLDDKLVFTSKGKSSYPAVGIRQADGWYLHAMYPDTTVLLKAYFKDKNFTIKNGPYVLFHPKNLKAIEGTFRDNLPEGVWRYWYSNGKLKDSGLLINNVMCGQWQSYSPDGRLLIKVNYKAQPVNRAVNHPGKKAEGVLPGISPYPGVKHGVTTLYYTNGQMQDSGNYVNDAKSGLWKSWYQNGTISAEGTYDGDSLAGNWSYYRENGKKSTDEQYQSGKLKAMTCYDSLGNKESNYCSILKPPIPLGPFDDFSEYMLDNVFWPKELVNSNSQGLVKVEFIVTKDGDISNFKVVESPHQLLSDEVTRFFSTIEKWSPAVSHNRLIDFKMNLEVPFYR